MSEIEKTPEGTHEVSKPLKKASKKKAVEAADAPRKATMPRRERVHTFEQWARRRGVKQHHKGGLRAYVPDVERSRSLDGWDSCFKDY